MAYHVPRVFLLEINLNHPDIFVTRAVICVDRLVIYVNRAVIHVDRAVIHVDRAVIHVDRAVIRVHCGEGAKGVALTYATLTYATRDKLNMMRVLSSLFTWPAQPHQPLPLPGPPPAARSSRHPTAPLTAIDSSRPVL
jgi:hypothetical protein